MVTTNDLVATLNDVLTHAHFSTPLGRMNMFELRQAADAARRDGRLTNAERTDIDALISRSEASRFPDERKALGVAAAWILHRAFERD